MKRVSLSLILILVILSSVPVVFADEPIGVINVQDDNTPILTTFLNIFVNIVFTIILWRVVMTLIKLAIKYRRKKEKAKSPSFDSSSS